MGRFDPFAKPSGNGRYLRIGAVHRGLRAGQRAQASDWLLTPYVAAATLFLIVRPNNGFAIGAGSASE
jgi:hypothetical protein